MSKKKPSKRKSGAAVRSTDGLGTVDDRVAFLREGKTDILLALLGEIVTPADLGCSRNFFLLAMDKRFRKTQPEELYDLIAGVLRERVPNDKLTHPAGGGAGAQSK